MSLCPGPRCGWPASRPHPRASLKVNERRIVLVSSSVVVTLRCALPSLALIVSSADPIVGCPAALTAVDAPVNRLWNLVSEENVGLTAGTVVLVPFRRLNPSVVDTDWVRVKTTEFERVGSCGGS